MYGILAQELVRDRWIRNGQTGCREMMPIVVGGSRFLMKSGYNSREEIPESGTKHI
jgi:hypothetical protein